MARAPVDVAPPVAEVESPLIALDDNGNAVAAWIAVRVEGGSRTEAVEAAFRPAGGSWSAPAALSAPAANFDYLNLAVDGRGDAVALWRRVGDGRVLATARPSASGSWQEAREIGVSSGQVDLSLDRGGNAVASWLVPGAQGSQDDVATALRPGASGTWHTASIAARGAGFDLPDIELDRAGNATVVWAGGSPTQFVQVAELRSVGPLLENVMVPRARHGGRPGALPGPWRALGVAARRRADVAVRRRSHGARHNRAPHLRPGGTLHRDGDAEGRARGGHDVVRESAGRPRGAPQRPGAFRSRRCARGRDPHLRPRDVGRHPADPVRVSLAPRRQDDRRSAVAALSRAHARRRQGARLPRDRVERGRIEAGELAPRTRAGLVGLDETDLCRRGSAGRHDARSSRPYLIWALPASLPRGDQRHPSDEAVSSNPPSAARGCRGAARRRRSRGSP